MLSKLLTIFYLFIFFFVEVCNSLNIDLIRPTHPSVSLPPDPPYRLTLVEFLFLGGHSHSHASGELTIGATE
jgi:hypothetical protein